MGSGIWTKDALATYTVSSRGCSLDDFTTMDVSTQDVYKATKLNKLLDPFKAMRECRDNDEHPNTMPVILALDVTGSMGGASVAVAKQLGQIMEDVFSNKDVPDVEFCVMAIGDLAYDREPIQMGQFESDIRIAEQLDAIYFEGCGGGNKYESYTAAWYMGLNHCDLDCWKRGQKGIIITLGDELPNPHLPIRGNRKGLIDATGDNLQGNIETKDLLPEVREKFNVYHISVNDSQCSYEYNNRCGDVDKEWKALLGEDCYFVCGLNNLGKTISDIIVRNFDGSAANPSEVSW